MSDIKKDLKKIILAGIVSIILYSFLHELGHCIAIWIYEGRIKAFRSFMLYGHAAFEGDAAAWKPLVELAGVLLTTLTAFCLLFTYRRGSGRSFVYYLKTTYIFVCILLLDSWISMSIMYLMGAWDSWSDVQKFILKSGIPPVAVMAAATALIIFMVFIFIKRLTAAEPSQWQKKNMRNMGILLVGIMMLVGFSQPLFMSLDARLKLGSGFRVTEKDGSQESILKKQFETVIEEQGTYILKMRWSADGFITGVIVRHGDKMVFYCTAEKIFMDTKPMELESGNYTFSLYCLNSMEDLEKFYDIVGQEVPETDYNFRGADKYAVFGGYEFVRSLQGNAD